MIKSQPGNEERGDLGFRMAPCFMSSLALWFKGPPPHLGWEALSFVAHVVSSVSSFCSEDCRVFFFLFCLRPLTPWLGWGEGLWNVNPINSSSQPRDSSSFLIGEGATDGVFWALPWTLHSPSS